jgi:hypothetical protein
MKNSRPTKQPITVRVVRSDETVDLDGFVAAYVRAIIDVARAPEPPRPVRDEQ